MATGTADALRRWAAAARTPPRAPEPWLVIWLTVPAGVLALAAVALWLAEDRTAGFHLANALGRHVPDPALALLTSLGDTGVALALFLPVLVRRPDLAAPVLIATVLGLAMTHGIKQPFPLLRPAGLLAADSFHAVGRLARTESFPSGHSQTALTLAGILMALGGGAAARGALLAAGVSVAFSRVLVGMHFPVDVLAGAAGGLVAAALGLWLAPRLRWICHPVAALALLALCGVAVTLLLVGHPPDYPGTHGVFRALGAAIALTAVALAARGRVPSG